MSLSRPLTILTDRQLVEHHLSGDRTAFRQIVERHQAMVCALGLSACGDIGRSEDLAQEVFVVAWKQLPELRETDKLRGWLAGITRNLLKNTFRRDQRTPTARAAELSAEIPSGGAGPRDHAITVDDATLMWRALESIPENYREPMVLFYREQRSVPAVAATLEISEEAVRQRLVRGRAMLTERMAKLVEETLERTAPTAAFSGAVLLAVPVGMGPVAVEASLGAGTGGGAAKTAVAASGAATAMAKGGIAVKLVAALAALPTLMNGLTEYLRFRAHIESGSTQTRGDIIKLHLLPQLVSGALLGGIVLIFWLPGSSTWKPLALIPFALLIAASARFDHRRAKVAAADLAGRVAPVFEYRSSGEFLGLPWVHVRAGGTWRGKKAVGWIAISDGFAFGGLFAGAPLAVAPVSVGGFAAVGALALGGLAVGLAVLGVCVGGIWAAGGMAFAIHAAQGGLAIAPEFAQGAVAMAAHANDEVARAFFQDHVFFSFTRMAWRVALWAVFFGWLPPLLLISWHLWTARDNHK